jgi:ABC-2 type transport system ATP-binding protein
MERDLPMIRLEKLTKFYRNFKAVDEVDLHVFRGEIFGFLGPNGAGKTSINRILAGLMLPTSGNVQINGMDLIQNPYEIKKIMGFIPDRPFVYEKLTAFEFLEFVGEIYQVPRSEIRKRGENLLHQFGISENAQDLIESFSHGMRQRLVMASSLIHKPKLLIIDEPMVGIDPSGAHRVKEIFNRLKKEGTTIFMSTHVLGIAQQICDRLAIINKGKIIALGTLKEILALKKGSSGDLEELFLNLTMESVLSLEAPSPMNNPGS